MTPCLIQALICLLICTVSEAELRFNMEKFPRKNKCARLRCWIHRNDPEIQGKLLYATLYRMNEGGSTKLATIWTKSQDIYINPTENNALNVKGSMTNNRLNLRVDLRNKQACDGGVFQCEVGVLLSNGQKQLLVEEVSAADKNLNIPQRSRHRTSEQIDYRRTRPVSQADGAIGYWRTRPGPRDDEIVYWRTRPGPRDDEEIVYWRTRPGPRVNGAIGYWGALPGPRDDGEFGYWRTRPGPRADGAIGYWGVLPGPRPHRTSDSWRTY